MRIGTFLSDRMLPSYEQAAAVIGGGAEVVPGGDFAALAAGDLDLAFLCGLPYVNLRDGGADVEPLVAPVDPGGGGPIYFSDVVVRRGTDADRIEDLAPGRLAVNEPESHSGWSIVLATLEERGVPTGAFAEVVRTGGHERSLAAVREGEADVAAIDSHLLAVLGLGPDLEVVERLGPSPSQPLAAGPNTGPQEREAIRAALSETGAWAPVTDAAYDPIRAMRDRAAARGSF